MVFDGTHGVMRATKDVQAALFGFGCRHRRRPQSGASSRGGLATPECLYVQTVGTFDVGSAAYSWERAADALSRLTQYVVSICAFFWLYVMADDLDIEAAGPAFRAALLRSCVGRGVPIAGRRCAAAPWSNGSAMNSACGSVESEFRQGGVQRLERSRDREHSSGGGRRWTSFIHRRDVGVRETRSLGGLQVFGGRRGGRWPAYVLLSLRFLEHSLNVITSLALPALFSSESRRTGRRRDRGDQRVVALPRRGRAAAERSIAMAGGPTYNKTLYWRSKPVANCIVSSPGSRLMHS